MKRKIISTLFALVLVTGLSLIPAVPAAAAPLGVTSVTADPDPFNPTIEPTTITVIADAAQANLVVDVFSEDSAIIYRSGLVLDEAPAGTYTTDWDGKDDVVEFVSDATYLLKVRDTTDGAYHATTGTVTVDTEPPVLESAETKTTTTIDVVFDEDIDAASVATADFNVDEVEPAGFSVAANIVTLTVSTMGRDATPTVTLLEGQGVDDLAGNMLSGPVSVVAADGVPPASPTGLTATAQADGPILVDWTHDGVTVVQYNIYRATTSGAQNYAEPPSATVTDPAITEYLDEDTLDGTEYFYVVRAEDAAGNEDANTDEASATSDATAPAFISVVTTDADDIYKNTDTIHLTATLDAAGYTVTADFSAIDSGYTADDEVVVDAGGGTYTITYTITEGNTVLDGEHAITVTAEDAAGNEATDSSFTAILDNTPPSAVYDASPADGAYKQSDASQAISVTVDDVTQTAASITLNYWREVVDDGDSDGVIDAGEVQIAAMSGAQGTTTTYTATIDDTGVAEGDSVSYWVTGTDAAENAIPEELGGSAAAPLATYTIDDTAPSVPANLVATAEPGAIVLTWEAATDDLSLVAGYNVYRGTNEGGPYPDLINSELVTELTYSDTTGAPGTEYFYVVTAVDNAGNEGAESVEASATYIAGLPANVAVAAAPTSIAVATGTSTITATVTDQYNNNVEDGTVVSFATTLGLVSLVTDTTTNGIATTTLSAGSLSGTATVTATADSASGNTTVEFTSLQAANATVIAEPMYIPADGTSTLTITVTLVDEHGNTVNTTGTSVYLETTAGTLNPESGATEAGVFTSTLTSSTSPAEVTVSVNVGGVFSGSVSVDFRPPLEPGQIGLRAGWNAISLPLIPDDPSIEVVLVDVIENVEVVWAYDPISRPEEPWFSYSPEAPPDLTDMKDGLGYWIKMSAGAILTINGVVQPEPPELPKTYPVVAGWNFIGFKSVYPMGYNDYLVNIAGSYSVIWGYGDDQFYDVYPLEHQPYLLPGSGYWIWVTAAGIIVPPGG